jgi:serine/threonine protein kinase
MKSDVTQVLIIEEGGDYEDVDEAQLPYVLVQNLGHGHSGNVEEVRDKHTNTTYARKTIAIPPNKATKIERMKVFKNEVEIIRGLDNHRHIVSVFATYATKRHFGIILQPVASDGDLGSFLSGYWDNISELDDSDSSAQRLTTMATVLERGFGCLASGLEFMHERNIRHKDIKPHNILVHKGRLIYTDFGYSFDSTGFSRSTTVGRPSFFTPRYSAPEVAEHEDRDSRSDVFSLGCVFFDMLLALTRTLHSEEIERFATKVCLLHKQILECQAPPSICTVPYVITKMTVYTALERFSASQAKIIILDSPGSGCLDCKAIDLDQRRSRGGAEEISTSTLMKPQNPQGSTSQHITETECLSNDNKLFKQDTVQCDADDHLPHHGHAHTSVYNATSAVDDSASTISTSHDAMSDCSGGPHRAKDHHLRSVREDDGEEDKTMETAKLDREAFSPRRVAKSDKRPTSSGVSVTRGRDHIFYANVTSTTSGTPDHSPNCSKRRGSWPQAIASPGNFKSIYPGYGSISDTSERRPWVWSDTSRSFNHITFDRNSTCLYEK